MKKGDSANNKGFTIIEVALVLAIAGLIFMMVFIALPALQRSQRDTRRRDDMLTFLSTVKKYQQNNRGALPTGTNVVAKYRTTKGDGTSWQDFYDHYLGDDFTDPGGDHYRLEVYQCDAQPDNACAGSYADGTKSVYASAFPYNDYSMVVVTQAVCSGDKAVGSSNVRRLAVLYRLEGAGVYCANT